MTRSSEPKRLRELSDSLPTALSTALHDFAAQGPLDGDIQAVGSALTALGLPIPPPPAVPLAPLKLAATKLAAAEIMGASAPAASTTALSFGSVAAALGVGLASGVLAVAVASVALPSAEPSSAQAPSSASQRPPLARSLPLSSASERSLPSEVQDRASTLTHDSVRPSEPSREVSPLGVKQSAPESPAPASPSDSGSEALESESELALLARAQRALATDPALALTLARDHERRFATSQLGQEREVIEVQALVRLGRRAEAEARAAAFRRRYPNSAHARRIDVVLGKENN